MASDPVAAIQHWARQTLAFAIGLRTDPSWVSLPEQEQANRAATEAPSVCETLWIKAQGLCVQDLKAMPKLFAKLVLKWVQDNIPLTD